MGWGMYERGWGCGVVVCVKCGVWNACLKWMVIVRDRK